MRLLPKLFIVIITAMTIIGCGSKPLVHDYQGDVNIRTLQVTFAPIRDPEQNLSGDYKKITKVIKGVQEVFDLMDPTQSKELVEQLHTFEKALVEGLRKQTGIPIKSEPESEVNMQYGDENELQSIEYHYPLIDGAYLNLFVTIYYTERSDLAIGMEEYNANFIALTPEIILQIDGYNEKGNLFWRQVARHQSDKSYKFGDSYILGVPKNRLEDAQVFLVPMAKGVMDTLQVQ